MKYFNPRKKRIAEINVIPYIDVMLVLLVIFVATAPMVMQGVQVDLPKLNANAIGELEQLPVIISIDAENNVYLNIAAFPHKPIDHKQLQVEVAAAVNRQPERLVMVKADQRVSYSNVLYVMVLLQHSGVNKVGLETEGLFNVK